MIAQAAAASGNLVVVGHDGAAVAHHREVLGRIEREHAGPAEAADLLAVPRRAVRLRAVLEDPEAEPRRQVPQGIDVHRLTVEVHRHDSDGARRRRVAASAASIVYQRSASTRRGSPRRSRWPRGRKRRVRGDEDLVAALTRARAASATARPWRIAQHAVAQPTYVASSASNCLHCGPRMYWRESMAASTACFTSSSTGGRDSGSGSGRCSRLRGRQAVVLPR